MADEISSPAPLFHCNTCGLDKLQDLMVDKGYGEPKSICKACTVERLRKNPRVSREKLIEQAKAAVELRKRYNEQRIKFYHPCCRVHGTKGCPDGFHCKDSKHILFHKSTKQTRIVLGGNRSSKTFTCMKEVVFRSGCFRIHPLTREPLKIEGVRGRIGVPDFAILEKKHLEDLFHWMPKNHLREGHLESHREAFDKSYDQRNHILYLKRDCMIDFISYDQDTSKGESVELDFCFADEEMPEDWYGATTARLITRNGKFWMGVTPLYGLTWGMKFLDGGNPNVEIFQWEIWDNPYNTTQAIEAFMAETPEHERDARIYGRFMELAGLVYKELDPHVHKLSDFVLKSYYPVVMAMDPHPRKATVITWAAVTENNDVVFFDELEIKGTAKEITSAIRAKEASHAAATTFRVIDPAARAQGSSIAFQTDTLTEFEKEGLSFALADNQDHGYNVVHERLTYDKKKAISSLNRPTCYFTQSVPLTWKGMTHLLWDDWSTKRFERDQKEKVKDKAKDFPDCVRYTLVSRPRYHTRIQPVRIGNLVHPAGSSQSGHKNQLADILGPMRRKMKERMDAEKAPPNV